MRDGGHTAQQILDRAPRQPDRLWDGAVLFERRIVWTIDVRRPLACVQIESGSEAREQIQFKMVMRIDEPGQQQMTGDIHLLLAGRVIAPNAAVADREVHPRARLWACRYSRAAQSDGVQVHCLLQPAA